jgi:glycerol-3-phosphate acyltransferase PlsY
MPIFSWFLPQLFDIEENLPITLGFVALLLIALVKRLATPRTPLSKSVPRGRLFINRLLFDRDIRDRKVWLEAKKPQKQPES